MDKILQQLYNGEISPVEQYRPLMKEYQELRKNSIRIMWTLKKNWNDYSRHCMSVL